MHDHISIMLVRSISPPTLPKMKTLTKIFLNNTNNALIENKNTTLHFCLTIICHPFLLLTMIIIDNISIPFPLTFCCYDHNKNTHIHVKR